MRLVAGPNHYDTKLRRWITLMLGVSGGKYWAALRTPLPPPSPPPTTFKNMHWGLRLCSTVHVAPGVTSYFIDACSGWRLRMTQRMLTWSLNEPKLLVLSSDRFTHGERSRIHWVEGRVGLKSRCGRGGEGNKFCLWWELNRTHPSLRHSAALSCAGTYCRRKWVRVIGISAFLTRAFSHKFVLVPLVLRRARKICVKQDTFGLITEQMQKLQRNEK
jgi:hypothetical protein